MTIMMEGKPTSILRMKRAAATDPCLKYIWQKAPFQNSPPWNSGAWRPSSKLMSGLGFAVLPYITVKNEVNQGGLSIMEHNESFEPIYSYLLVKSKKWHSPAVEKFIDLTLKNGTS
jgi:hypothetical protein